MEPYYEHGGITIYHGDCREVLPSLPRAGVDLMLTDPPFFMPAVHYSSRKTWPRSWGDVSILGCWWREVIDLVVPALRDSGHCMTFCDGDSYPVFYPEMYRRFDFLTSIVWDKQHFGMGKVWRKQHELVIAARWNDSEFSDDSVTRSDVLKHSPVAPDKRLHPAEKPIGLLSDLILPTVRSGGCVLDVCVGSGATLDAAKKNGIRAIGIESEERYCEIAANRLRQEVLF